jgi:hypothetical protein
MFATNSGCLISSQSDINEIQISHLRLAWSAESVFQLKGGNSAFSRNIRRHDLHYKILFGLITNGNTSVARRVTPCLCILNQLIVSTFDCSSFCLFTSHQICFELITFKTLHLKASSLNFHIEKFADRYNNTIFI